jgi:hypothetical protein
MKFNILSFISNQEDSMNKLAAVLSVFVFLLVAGTAQAQQSRLSSSINGIDWMSTTQAEKLAFVEGINYAIAIEFEIEKVRQKENKPSIISPFEQAWVKKFSSYTTSQIVQEIDHFYKESRERLNVSLGRVIWYEMLNPQN